MEDQRHSLRRRFIAQKNPSRQALSASPGEAQVLDWRFQFFDPRFGRAFQNFVWRLVHPPRQRPLQPFNSSILWLFTDSPVRARTQSPNNGMAALASGKAPAQMA